MGSFRLTAGVVSKYNQRRAAELRSGPRTGRQLRRGHPCYQIRWIVFGAVGIGMSIFLIALGAILRYAITVSISGIELQTVGLILMIVGIIGLVITLFITFQRRDDYDYSERPTRRY
jgi:hypothetical protein